MPFPLDKFDSFVDPKIEERGYRYYMNGAIASLEEIKTNQWQAEVMGSESRFDSLKFAPALLGGYPHGLLRCH